jgi:ubiquinone/menaquinone biosynthesis C-methylase UbiE
VPPADRHPAVPPAVNYQRFFVPAIGAPLAGGLVEAAALTTGERVVDIACGTGVVTRLAAERVGAPGVVTGVDVNPGMLAVARSIPSRGAAIEWREADAAATGLPDAAYDAALCQMGLQFFTDRAAALRELRRLLTTGGRVAINVPGPMPEMFAVLEHSLADHVSREAAGFVAMVFTLAEPVELDALLEDAGFSRIAISRRRTVLRLPTPSDFLWQYLSSTPLAPAVAGAGDRARDALTREVVGRWTPFSGDDGAMALELEVVTACGRG